MADLEVQRAAMKKLSFLVGKWTGECRLLQRSGDLVSVAQSEEAQYKLGGLVLVIEGLGQSKTDGTMAMQALGIITFDDASGTYQMRAFNDGRFVEAEVKLLLEGNGITWGFSSEKYKTASVLRVSEEGVWTERSEITIGSQPPVTFLEMAVHREILVP